MFGTRKKVEVLKNNGEDFEFYPTTDEIFRAIEKDLINTCLVNDFRYNQCKRGEIDIDYHYNDDKRINTVNIDSLLDIGAGDGRIFNKLKTFQNHKITIRNRFGIEKAKLQANDLIINGVGLIGRDYFETVLIDKYYDVVFSNPPYSVFKEWCSKLLDEVNATFIYLVIPQRWKTDDNFKSLFYKKGQVEILGNYSFTDGEREARAIVDLIKITPSNKTDTFDQWVEKNIGKFEVNNETVPELKQQNKLNNDLDTRNSNNITVLVENYKKDLSNLMETFISLGKIDFSIIAQLGVDRNDVINKVKSDIKSLKTNYWKKTFNTLSVINEKLTYKTRRSLIDKIQWFKQLDFNSNNIYTIIIWVIENFNNYTKEQMLQVYDDLTNFEKVRAYKSNDRWINDNWRHTQMGGVPEKYSLDYRIVVPIGYKISKYDYDKSNNPINDLSIVATSLGFNNTGIDSYELKQANTCKMIDGTVLFEYRIHQNNNVHFKLNKKFLQALNIEVGKLKGWLKQPDDIVSEFNVSKDKAISMFTQSELQLMNENTQLMIGFEY